ncbi:16S rRNA (cytosine(967)-C(5))-methyltransferase [Lentilactobacillus curieae]|uniref:16S rRNA (cytosine(967)-C(5))-methyltransferase n=1 Tax=Lentilactobacillus curieae TaxID=1138822 RepID=A0A1S6QKB0_9LACO|nr:16S rRNA (cytosine(967)-C(5))-methyltransferase RsmB [Lentilactobacillus curieae]AQW22013.1 16S rRNA (cytosine(967)-C(5))-methyltransferase [Lentilactobacillus curieae]
MKTVSNNPRELAMQTLVLTAKGAYSNLQINSVLEKTTMGVEDRALYTNIVYGVLQHMLTFEYQLAPFLKNADETEDWVKELLYTAIYQLEYLDRVPKRAIFDETIKIAKKNGHDGIRRMVTGILHSIDRKGLADPKKIKNRSERLSIETSVPVWIVKILTEQLEGPKAESILRSINHPAKQSVRINQASGMSKEEIVSKLESEGFEVFDSEVAANGLVLQKKLAINSELFADGTITIQDESAMLPVESMSIAGDDQVLDACSAPGGKTTQIAEELTTGMVTALDIHDKKLRVVRRNAERMNLADKVTTVPLDARKVDEKFADEQFAEILVDAPCSGLGLIRRKPEIRYSKTLADSEKLSGIQKQILDAVAPKVKVGGTITYSTCTILNQENQDVVSEFLDAHPNFSLETVSTQLDLSANIKDKLLKIYPDDYNSDGFFVSTLRRDK